ncbi:MAG: cupin domain-containing protein [Granulosicoccus sp.]|nr:cupin domain-containing protein [Granulosicoccus sp.]
MPQTQIDQASKWVEILHWCQKLLSQYDSERAKVSTQLLESILGSPIKVNSAEAISQDPILTESIDFPLVQSSGFAASERERLLSVATELTWFLSSRSHCPYAQVVGPEAPIRHTAFRLGFFILPPGTHYANHLHVAEEIYVLISGSGSWSLDNAKFQRYGEGDLVDVASMVPHALQTEESAVLTLYTWTGHDVSFDKYRYCD